ncbi:winged helix-turn-helix domain-containing protein [Sphingopyxis sp. KK2]|uniref:winged helix-turn-helix domain-containing protein n=1 Tax=Sphingopyxis sp. KK2 TaxID=1855727 RepID=UPI001181B4C8|nr:crosslink repair DNA glycosylase YcaQ family protein [Sphingopyxis sp. KK2]
MRQADARRLWLRAQRLDDKAPFGAGAGAVEATIGHLGYVQIDTINVIERCHHHILWSRIPTYRKADLEVVQSCAKSAFEYWAHALAYIPTSDYRFFVPAMQAWRAKPHPSFAKIDPEAYAALLARIRDDGPLSLRDIDDEQLEEKQHPWASRKPSKRLLNYGFWVGDLTVSARTGMLKTYDLTGRHFGWTEPPRASTPDEFANYLLDRGLRTQGVVSLENATYGNAPAKAAVARLAADRVARGTLVPVEIEGLARASHWAEPRALDELRSLSPARRIHLLSPFDPLVIQRKRLAALFGHDHRFEAYVPADKRVLGYFALPVLADDRIVAAIDTKMDRKARALAIQKWTWLVPETKGLRSRIETALGRFEAFQKKA